MKKSVVFVFISAILLISMFGVVSAAANDVFKPIWDMVSSLINGAITFAQPLLQSLVGDISPAGIKNVAGGAVTSADIFFAKVVLLIILI